MQTVEALPTIISKIPEVCLVFAGRFSPPGYEMKLKERAIELGVENHLRFESMLPYKINLHRTSQMEAGCVFYEDNVNNKLTIPNRLFEYMYAGAAVIGESFYEIKKVIEESECGVVVNSSDPLSIADGVIRLFSEIPKLREMQSNARKSVISKYSYEHELKKLIYFYKILLKISTKK